MTRASISLKDDDIFDNEPPEFRTISLETRRARFDRDCMKCGHPIELDSRYTRLFYTVDGISGWYATHLQGHCPPLDLPFL